MLCCVVICAVEFSRDLEPTVEGGDTVWRVASACIALYRAGKTCQAEPTSACCTTEDKLIWNNVWSLARRDGSDYLLTTDVNEKDTLVRGGQWLEQCNVIGGPSVFCVDGGLDGRYMWGQTFAAW